MIKFAIASVGILMLIFHFDIHKVKIPKSIRPKYSNYHKVISDKESGVFMWDGVAVNLDSLTIGCKQYDNHIISYLDWADRMTTNNCSSFERQLDLCLHARNASDKTGIISNCFKHEMAQARIYNNEHVTQEIK